VAVYPGDFLDGACREVPDVEVFSSAGGDYARAGGVEVSRRDGGVAQVQGCGGGVRGAVYVVEAEG